MGFTSFLVFCWNTLFCMHVFCDLPQNQLWKSVKINNKFSEIDWCTIDNFSSNRNCKIFSPFKTLTTLFSNAVLSKYYPQQFMNILNSGSSSKIPGFRFNDLLIFLVFNFVPVLSKNQLKLRLFCLYFFINMIFFSWHKK